MSDNYIAVLYYALHDKFARDNVVFYNFLSDNVHAEEDIEALCFDCDLIQILKLGNGFVRSVRNNNAVVNLIDKIAEEIDNRQLSGALSNSRNKGGFFTNGVDQGLFELEKKIRDYYSTYVDIGKMKQERKERAQRNEESMRSSSVHVARQLLKIARMLVEK